MRTETEAAIRAARIALEIADSRTGADQISSKGGIDLVTNTDLACEDAIRAELVRSFPDYPVIGEERGGTPAAGKPYWLVDPICGTRPFASNIPLYCTNIALIENGAVSVAAVGIGRTGEFLYAEAGKGSRIQSGGTDRQIRVGDSSNTVWIDGNTEQAASVVKRLLLSKRWYVWQFSSTVAYAYMACGRLAAAVQIKSGSTVAPYGSVHAAAGCFMAREAGAVVTDLDSGGPLELQTRSVLMAASNELHRDLSEIIE